MFHFIHLVFAKEFFSQKIFREINNNALCMQLGVVFKIFRITLPKMGQVRSGKNQVTFFKGINTITNKTTKGTFPLNSISLKL